jgi:hypothetical protein
LLAPKREIEMSFQATTKNSNEKNLDAHTQQQQQQDQELVDDRGLLQLQTQNQKETALAAAVPVRKGNTLALPETSSSSHSSPSNLNHNFNLNRSAHIHLSSNLGIGPIGIGIESKALPQSKSHTDMRRRKDPRSYYPSNDVAITSNNNASLSQQGISNPKVIDKDTFGYFQRPSASNNNTNANSPIIKKSATSPSSPAAQRPHPNIAEFMPADQQYISFLLSGNHSNSGKIHYAQNTNPNSYQSQPFNLQISKFATIFSLIATFILLLFGILLETQPLYIKGVSPARTPLNRNLHGQYTQYSWVHFSARLRILQNITFSNENTNHEEMDRMMKSMGMVFEMKSEAKVAFKTAALYFLIMILSIVYTQNHVLIHANYQKMHVWGTIKALVSMTPRYIALLVRKYRRRNYKHVQDVGTGAGVGAGGPGLGLAKVNINAMNMNMNRNKSMSRNASGSVSGPGGGRSLSGTHLHSSSLAIPGGNDSSHEEDYDSGLEELGLSMRERSKDGDNLGFASSALKMIMSKSKKK